MSSRVHKHKRFRSQVRAFGEGIELASGFCRDYAFPPHVHAGLTLGLVVSGREEIQSKNSFSRVEGGAVYLIPPDTVHAAKSYEKSSWRYYSAYVPYDHATRFFDGAACGDVRFDAFVMQNSRASHVARQLAALSKAQDRLQLDVCLYDALSAACALDPDVAVSASAHSHSSARKVREYIDAFYMHDISLSQLAGLAGWSAQYLISAFRKQTGATPYAYLIARRLSVARSRLLKGEPLSAIAMDCGFFDQSHLNRHFVRVFGLSPAAYRKSMRS